MARIMHYAKHANKPHEIVPLIGRPDSQEPYVNPDYPTVPTGAFVEYWACGCSATPYGFGNTSLRWAQCAEHRDVDIS
jgi:hypothetical protein